MKHYAIIFLLLNVITQARVEHTFAMIKPDAVEKGYTGDIIALIERNGFEIIEMGKKRFTRKEVEEFYVNKGKHSFDELVQYIMSGPVVGLTLKKENAIADWCTLKGKSNPKNASVGTVRKMFGKTKRSNAVHGSDSAMNAERELKLFFSKKNNHLTMDY